MNFNIYVCVLVGGRKQVVINCQKWQELLLNFFAFNNFVFISRLNSKMQSLYYFLNAKQKHEILEIYLKEIINIYDDLIKNTELQDSIDYNNEEVILNFKKIKKSYEEKLIETNETSNLFHELCQEVCEHNYIIDLIDITLDNSKTIEYCQICGNTKE